MSTRLGRVFQLKRGVVIIMKISLLELISRRITRSRPSRIRKTLPQVLSTRLSMEWLILMRLVEILERRLKMRLLILKNASYLKSRPKRLRNLAQLPRASPSLRALLPLEFYMYRKTLRMVDIFSLQLL